MTVVRLTATAEQDVEKAVAWYDRQRPGLGPFFLLDLEQAIDRIRLFPDGYPMVRPLVRRMLLARFPYAVVYRQYEPGIVVIAVLHQMTHGERTLERVQSK